MQVQTQAVRLPLYMLEDVKKRADAEMRSVPKQIEYYYNLGKIAKDNPDLPLEFIAGLIEGLADVEEGRVYQYNGKIE